MCDYLLSDKEIAQLLVDVAEVRTKHEGSQLYMLSEWM